MNIITAHGDRSLRSLIDTEQGTVSRELYTNPDIFEQEQEQIFGRCWLFLGHESQLKNPGDFVVTRMGTEEVLLVRDRKDKRIRAFLNSCAHRGMKVCRYDQGNALVFTCPFHAWTYDTAGRLVGAAMQYDPRAYAGDLDKESWGLTEVAQFKNYYGSLWATWDPKAPSFEDYVGPFAEGIRYDCEASDGEEAAIEVFTPFQKWRLPTNWKVPAFSSSTDL
ncbi:MAG: Rieske 2Fe-2S domain-containing protein, partial [Deltaproteobacteria bacterium]|nr:Rieske 2Fe-2S domain-containing protein [Deltaproteobacteria bacterium]